MEINEAITVLLDHDNTPKEIAASVEITPGMVSHYLKNGNYPSLKTAALMWGVHGMQVEPFTDKALMKKYEELTNETTSTSN